MGWWKMPLGGVVENDVQPNEFAVAISDEEYHATYGSTSYWLVDGVPVAVAGPDSPAVGAEQIDQLRYVELTSPQPSRAPIVTALRGNGLSHTTSPSAKRVTVTVVAPVGGNMQGRPQLDGVPICATPGGSPFVFDAPGALTITTHAGSNDIIISEQL